jgi:hypothetical protein
MLKNKINKLEKNLNESLVFNTNQNTNQNTNIVEIKKKNSKLIGKTSNDVLTANNINSQQNIQNQHNIQNLNNIHNQQNININICPFGDENIAKLTEPEILSVLTSKSKIITNLIKTIHLNERLPEQNNILVNNLRSDYCSIMSDDNKLTIKNKNQMIADLIAFRTSDLKKLINQYKDKRKISNKDLNILTNVLDFLKNCYLEDEDVDGNIIKPEKNTLKKIKDLYKELIYMFYDNREMVQKSIDSDNKSNVLLEADQIYEFNQTYQSNKIHQINYLDI